MQPMPAQMKLWLDLGWILAEAADMAAREAARRVKRQLVPPRRGAFRTRRPGVETPMWNACVVLLRQELKPWGSKVRLARYLGVPKQRVTDYLKNRSRMPDAETLLSILNWLAQKRTGRDLSL
jgi:hypothetical protein